MLGGRSHDRGHARLHRLLHRVGTAGEVPKLSVGHQPRVQHLGRLAQLETADLRQAAHMLTIAVLELLGDARDHGYH